MGIKSAKLMAREAAETRGLVRRFLDDQHTRHINLQWPVCL